MNRPNLSPLLRLLRSEDGPTTVEYAVMLALILASIIAAIGSVGAGTGGMYSHIDSELNSHGF
ncbi:MAG: Flp family type IVb pilin [Planctomycetota bacterium]|nr:Flp family type IVb pilin [Planctomycetaceae bacterium]MDQ3332619.1 Flp family type IVb pilin [Planctomycetota bacterium]